MSRLARTDEGSIAPAVPAVILVLLLIGGLVIDGARDLNAHGDAQGYAEEAARAGATGIDPANAKLALDRGSDERSVSALVTRYCDAVKSSDAKVVTCGLADNALTDAVEPDNACDDLVQQPLVVNTVVTMRIQTTLLGLVGLQALTATGTGKARPYQGTNGTNAC